MYPRVKNFLIVFSLKSGSFTTGIFFTFVYLTSSITLALQASSPESENVPTYLLLSALSCLLLATCFGLVWGTWKGNRGFLRVWVAVHCTVATIAVPTFAVAALVCLFSDIQSLAAAFLGGCFSTAAFYGYGLLVVNSYLASTKPQRPHFRRQTPTNQTLLDEELS